MKKKPTHPALAPFPRSRAATGALLAAALWAGQAQAADITWQSNASTDWNTATNWNPNAIPVTPNRALFDGTGSQNGVTFAADVGGGSGVGGILVAAGQTSALSINSNAAGVVKFRLAGGTGITIQSGAGAFALGTSGSNFQLVPNTAGFMPLQNDSANTATLGTKITSIAGGGGAQPHLLFTGTGNWQVDTVLGSNVVISKQGTGTTTFTGNNAYSGGTSISNGTLIAAHASALGSGTVTFAIGSTTGVLDVQTDGGDTLSTFQIGSADAGTIASDVKTGTVGINHTYASLNIGNSSTLNITKGLNVASGAPSITINAVTLGAAGAGTTVFNATTADLMLGTLTVTGSGAKTVQLDGTSTGSAVTGVISNGTSSLAVTKAGAGTWTLSGANTYTGATKVNAGTLLVNGTHNAGAGTYSVGASGKLGGTGTITTTGTMTIDGQINGGDFGTVGTLNIANTSSFTLNGTYLFDVNYGSQTGDVLNLTGAGAVNIAGGTFDIGTAIGATPAAGSHYAIKIFQSDTSVAGAPAGQSNYAGALGSHIASYQSIVTWDGGKTYYLVPEPASFALLALGSLLLLRRPSRRRETLT